MSLSRRGFLTQCLALAAAPAIVRADSLMRVQRPKLIIFDDIACSPLLTEKALEDACIEIMKMTDPQGKRLGLVPASLIVPPNLYKRALELFSPNEDIPYRLVTGGVVMDEKLLNNSWYLSAPLR